MNDPLLDTMQEKPRPFKQIEILKKKVTFPVENAINSMMSRQGLPQPGVQSGALLQSSALYS